MPFADTEKPKTQFKKAEFVDLPQGKTIIRILDEKAVKKYIHFVRNVSIDCLGEDCPFCLTNKKIWQENSKNARQTKGYYPKRPRFFANVYDRTPVKVCPKCQNEVKAINNNFPMLCTCNESIVTIPIQPLNKVKILSKGPELFDQFNNFETAIQDAKGENIPLQSYDFMLIITGSGQETKTQAIPMLNNNDKLEAELKLFDLSEIGSIKLTIDEINDFLKGVEIKDIFNARKIQETEKSDISEEEYEAEKLAEQIANDVMNN